MNDCSYYAESQYEALMTRVLFAMYGSEVKERSRDDYNPYANTFGVQSEEPDLPNLDDWEWGEPVRCSG
jgi:hypothetical protein